MISSIANLIHVEEVDERIRQVSEKKSRIKNFGNLINYVSEGGCLSESFISTH